MRVMSRREAPPGIGVGWARADLSTGAGIEEAVAGIDVVVHAATSPGRRSREVDLEGTERLVRSAHSAGVRRLIYPSIVGVERVPFSYYRMKREAERVIEHGPLPHTILRATQFHAFVDRLFKGASRVPLVMPVPADIPVQTVASSEVARHLLGMLEQAPAGRADDFGGPEVRDLGELAGAWLASRGVRRRIVSLPIPGATARAFRAGRHTAPEGRIGRITFEEWLRGATATEAPGETE